MRATSYNLQEMGYDLQDARNACGMLTGAVLDCGPRNLETFPPVGGLKLQ
jgi:hypothetical protein